MIKFFEGLSTYIFDLFRTEFRRSLRGRIAYLLMRPGIARIRQVFDYERVGGSPLLGVRGTVIITHGRARRRMIGYGVAVAATMARTRVPELIGEALRPTGRAAVNPAVPAGDPADATGDADAARAARDVAGLRGAGARLVSGPELTVNRGVVDEIVRLAALEIPGVARVVARRSRLADAPRRTAGRHPLLRSAASASGSGSSPGRARRWSTLVDQVRGAVGAAVERLLGLRLESVTVTVDGVGA